MLPLPFSATSLTTWACAVAVGVGVAPATTRCRRRRRRGRRGTARRRPRAPPRRAARARRGASWAGEPAAGGGLAGGVGGGRTLAHRARAGLPGRGGGVGPLAGLLRAGGGGGVADRARAALAPGRLHRRLGGALGGGRVVVAHGLRDLGERGAVDLGQAVGDLARPGVPDGHAGDRLAGPRGLRGVLLAEDPVRDRAVLAHRRRAIGGQRGERGVGARADTALGQPEQLGQLRVVATLAQQQLEDGALVGRKGGERAHRQARG